MNFYCPNPACLQKCKSNRGISLHLHHSPQCRTVTPSYHLQIQNENINKFKPPTAKKQRTSDNIPTSFGPSQLVDETYLEDDGFDTTLPLDDTDEPHPPTPTLLDTVEQVDIYPTDEENELELYLAQLPEDVLDPMDQMELGTRTMFTPSRVSQSSITETNNVHGGHTLIPCPDYLSTGAEEGSLEITRSDPLEYLDLSKETQANTELLKILSDIGAPLHSYRTIIEWAQKHSLNGYTFQTSHSTYGSMISHLQKTFQMHEYRPTIYEVPLPCPSWSQFDHVVARVTTFNFTRLLHSLLSDPEINTPENLTIDPNNPFAEYPRYRRNASTNEIERIPYGEVHTGDWYHDTWAQMVRNTQSTRTKFNKNFMIGIILYTDNTVLNITGGLCCHPVNFTLSIFTEECRRNPKAWRTLGFIPQKQAYESRSTYCRSDANINNYRYHLLMRKIQDSYIQAQSFDALNGITIQLGGWIKRNVNLYIPLAYIIADVQEADQICSFYPTSAKEGDKRICRTCDVSVENACRTDIECHRYTKDDIMSLFEAEDWEGLDEINQRYVVNSFNLVDMGADKHGIYGKCHTEMMHALQEGIVKYLLEILFEVVLTPDKCSKMDNYITSMCQHLGDHGKDNFPRTSWKNGFCKLTCLTANDRMGKLFTCLLFLVTDKGSRVFDSFQMKYSRLYRKLPDKDEIRIDPSKEDMDLRVNFVEVFEMILCLWSWLKQDEYWRPGDPEYEEYVSGSIKTLINQMNHLLPRGMGRGWEITKVHELLHLILDIMKLGAHSNVNSDKCESSHKNMIKKPGQNALRRVTTMDSSIANRQVDRLIIDHAFSHVKQQSNQAEIVKPLDNHSHQTTRGMVHMRRKYDYSRMSYTYYVKHEWNDHRHNSSHMRIHDQGVCFWPIVKELNSYRTRHRWFDDDTYLCPTLTESRTDDGVLVRCHPDYRSTGPWYDWVVLDGTNGIDSMKGEPCVAKLISLVRFARSFNDNDSHDKPHYAIVRPMLRGSLMNHSVLTRSFKLQDGYELVPFSCIEDTTMCVPQDFGPETEVNNLKKPYLWVMPREDWAAEFVKPQDQYHRDKEAQLRATKTNHMPER